MEVCAPSYLKSWEGLEIFENTVVPRNAFPYDESLVLFNSSCSCRVFMWLFASTLFDIKRCFSRRRRSWWSPIPPPPPPQHGC